MNPSLSFTRRRGRRVADAKSRRDVFDRFSIGPLLSHFQNIVKCQFGASVESTSPIRPLCITRKLSEDRNAYGLPTHTHANMRHRRYRDAKPRGNCRARQSGSPLRNDLGNLRCRQFGVRIALTSHGVSKYGDGMKRVLSRSDPLKIAYAIIGLSAVLVIYLMRFGRTLAMKCFTYEPMDICDDTPRRPSSKADLQVAGTRFRRLQDRASNRTKGTDASAHQSRARNATHTPETGDFIGILKTGDRFPSFGLH